jgi:hypothetical protein
MLIDVWDELHSFFEGPADDDADIYVLDINPQGMSACLLYLLRQSRDCNSAFYSADDRQPVTMGSPQFVVQSLAGGQVVGGLWLNLPLLPPLGFFVQEPETMAINYSFGNWSALSVLALMDLLHRLKTFAPTAEFYLDMVHFSDADQEQFISVWKQYAQGV